VNTSRRDRRVVVAALVVLTLIGVGCSASGGEQGTAGTTTHVATAETTGSESNTTPAANESTTNEPAEIADNEPPDDTPTADDDGAANDSRFPDVVGVVARLSANNTWDFSVTLSSPYDSPERYADAWRVVGPDGDVYGVRELLHDHANEQPFTRSLSDVEIPADVATVTVEGRDQVNGWGGATISYDLPR